MKWTIATPKLTKNTCKIHPSQNTVLQESKKMKHLNSGHYTPL